MRRGMHMLTTTLPVPLNLAEGDVPLTGRLSPQIDYLMTLHKALNMSWPNIIEGNSSSVVLSMSIRVLETSQSMACQAVSVQAQSG